MYTVLNDVHDWFKQLAQMSHSGTAKEIPPVVINYWVQYGKRGNVLHD